MSNKITKAELESFRDGKSTSKSYSNGEVTVYWVPESCIHSAKCLEGLPGVFNSRRKPWIKLEEGTTADIIRVVNTCPSRALTYLRANARPTPLKKKTKKRKVNTKIQVLKDGPALVTGDFVLLDANRKAINLEGKVAALCRCGASLKKPFCDGTHKAVLFRDDN